MIGRIIKWGAFVGIILVAGISVYGVYLYRQIRDVAVRDEAHPAEVIIVLGAAQYNGRPSPVLKARLDHALELFQKGFAKCIITTGSYGPDPNISEAEVGRKYLVQRGVSVDQIVTEQGSGTTPTVFKPPLRSCRPKVGRPPSL